MEQKIAEPKLPCLDPNHNPASMLYRTPGTYEHVCPSCKNKIVFEVPLVIF